MSENQPLEYLGLWRDDTLKRIIKHVKRKTPGQGCQWVYCRECAVVDKKPHNCEVKK